MFIKLLLWASVIGRIMPLPQMRMFYSLETVIWQKRIKVIDGINFANQLALFRYSQCNQSVSKNGRRRQSKKTMEMATWEDIAGSVNGWGGGEMQHDPKPVEAAKDKEMLFLQSLQKGMCPFQYLDFIPFRTSEPQSINNRLLVFIC